MKDPKRKKVRRQVCKTKKNGEKKCKYKMVKRTEAELKSYDAMISTNKKSGRKYGFRTDLDVKYPGAIQK